MTEILITVAILALLSVALTMSVLTYIKKANDKEREMGLQQLQLALRLYKDLNGRYPPPGCPDPDPAWEWTSPGPGNLASTWYQPCDTGYITGLVPDYLPELPRDPVSEDVADKGFLYMTDPNGRDYKIIVHMSTEATTPANMGEPFSRCPADWETLCTSPRPDYCIPSNSFSVYTPGAACW